MRRRAARTRIGTDSPSRDISSSEKLEQKTRTARRPDCRADTTTWPRRTPACRGRRGTPRGLRTPALLHHQRRPAQPAAGHRPGRDQGVDRVLRRRRPDPRPRACPVRHAAAARAGPRAAGRRARPAQHRLHQHDPARARAVVPRRRVRRAADPGLYPVERGRHGVAGQPAGPRRRRPHRHLRLGGQPVRGRLQPLLPRQGPRRVRRPGLLPGPRRARHLRPRVPGGPADRAAARTGSARSCRTRAAACRPTRTRG